MAREPINPDVTQRDDAPYWAAALVLAVRSRNETRAQTAKQNLRRLGYTIDIGRKQSPKREASRD